MTRKPRFAELIERHERELYRYVFRMLGDAEDAADVLQETFLNAFRAFPRLPDGSNHRAWLYKIASRQSLSLLRSPRRKRRAPLAAADHVAAPNDDDPAARAETRRRARRLYQVVPTLPPRQRSALLLKKYDGLGYTEVAAALGCRVETARAHVYQAMRKVRAALKGETA